MKLDHWSVVSRATLSWIAPEEDRLHLSGIVEGHYRYPDGKEIITSRIAGRNGESAVTVSGHEYELGEISPEYESKYPRARARLLANLQPSVSEAEGCFA